MPQQIADEERRIKSILVGRMLIMDQNFRRTFRKVAYTYVLNIDSEYLFQRFNLYIFFRDYSRTREMVKWSEFLAKENNA